MSAEHKGIKPISYPIPVFNSLEQRRTAGFISDRVGKMPQDASVIGFHGTRLNTIVRLLETGKIPGTTQPDNPSGYRPDEKGDVFYAVNAADQDGIQFASWYARDNAHFLMMTELLGRDMETLTHGEEVSIRSFAHCLTDTPNEKHLTDYINIYPHTLTLSLDEVLPEAARHRGVLLAIDKSVQNEYKIDYGAEVYEDSPERRIKTGDGLPYRFIRGVLPLGRFEKGFFRRLKKSLKTSELTAQAA